MYSVIGTPNSRAFRVMWLLRELDQPFGHIPAPPRSDKVRAVNPAGKVPVLLVDGTPITDSTAILTFLCDRHGAMTHPAGTLERARQDALTQFLLDEFDAALWMAARHSFVLPPELRQSAIKDSLKWEFTRSQQTLMRHIGAGPFLMGSQMTLPDIILTHCGDWAETAGFPITETGFGDYLARMRQRPAYVAARNGALDTP